MTQALKTFEQGEHKLSIIAPDTDRVSPALKSSPNLESSVRGFLCLGLFISGEYKGGGYGQERSVQEDGG